MDFFKDGIDRLIPKNAIAIHNILNNKGFKTYFVGGALRDFYINSRLGGEYKIKDWDMTTEARHGDMMRLFNKILKVNENGRIVSKTSRAEILIPSIETTGVSINNNMFEVTPMHWKNGNEVYFDVDIVKDLGKRDFTINTLAYSPIHGFIGEFYNDKNEKISGIDDLARGLIKSTANPYESFSKNRYNMIRAFIFANRFDFKIDDLTFEAIVENIFEVNDINKGKLSVGFESLIMSKSIAKMEYMIEAGLFQALVLDFENNYGKEFLTILSEAKTYNNDLDYFERLKYVYDKFSNKDLLILLYKEFGVNKDMIYKLK